MTGEQAQTDFYTKLKDVVASAGPDGWLNWAPDFQEHARSSGPQT